MKKERGFTLIELLVVIAIIGLLSTMAVVALNSARQKSRDAKRIADVKQMQTALELYFNDQNAYPASAEVAAGGSIASSGVTYMAQVPTAPTPVDNPSGSTACTAANNAYVFTASGTGNSDYGLAFCLGAATGGLAAGVHTASPAGLR
jgi:general secretion pathway protein G